jgi:hypothetical protein
MIVHGMALGTRPPIPTNSHNCHKHTWTDTHLDSKTASAGAQPGKQPTVTVNVLPRMPGQTPSPHASAAFHVYLIRRGRSSVGSRQLLYTIQLAVPQSQGVWEIKWCCSKICTRTGHDNSHKECNMARACTGINYPGHQQTHPPRRAAWKCALPPTLTAGHPAKRNA